MGQSGLIRLYTYI